MRDSLPELRIWAAGPIGALARKQIDRVRAWPDVHRLAIMPDVHAGEEVANGCVLGTNRLVYPKAVGGDIGCGMTTIALKGDASVLADGDRAAACIRAWSRAIPILKHAGSSRREGGPPIDGLSADALRKAAGREGRVELGTLGRGNHFVELQVDEEGRAWILVHSGSRAMGQIITRHHLRIAEASGDPVGLDTQDAVGRAYLADAAWAVEYARLSRLQMLGLAGSVIHDVFGLEPEGGSVIDSPHNLARAETHDGEALIVHRKGAASARAGEPGVIPGSAGTFSVHVEGRGCADSMNSSSHGAGRVMNRTEARGRVTVRDLYRQLGRVSFDERLASKLVEEAPSVYRDLRVVLEAQRALVRVTRRLRPVVSMKGV